MLIVGREPTGNESPCTMVAEEPDVFREGICKVLPREPDHSDELSRDGYQSMKHPVRILKIRFLETHQGYL